MQPARARFAPAVRVRLYVAFTASAILVALDAAGIALVGRLGENPALARLFEPQQMRGPVRPYNPTGVSGRE